MSLVVVFIIGLLAFVLGLGTFIVWLAGRLNHQVSRQIFVAVERLIILGMVLGIISMFQPWEQALFQPGFLLLLTATLAYIVWSHIVPRGEEAEAQHTRLTIY